MRTVNFNNQDYSKIKSGHLSRGILFEDEGFPNTLSNLESLVGNSLSPPEFKRPRDICETAVLKVDGPPGAICLGSLSNINTILAMSLIAERTKLLENLFPDLKEQNNLNNISTYSGAFRVRFWIDGACTFVVVDDLLPMINGRFICPHSSTPNEFWPSILAKAYAKLLGGYDRLDKLRLEDALQDLTGCVLDALTFRNLSSGNELRRVEMFETLEQALSDGAINDLTTDPGENSALKDEENSATDQDEDSFDEMCVPRRLGTIDNVSGFCSNYAYMLTKTCVVPRNPTAMGAVLSAFKITQDAPKDRLLRLRSVLTIQSKATSFGEWKGAYSEGSQEWEDLSVRDRSRIGLVVSTESEFWIPLSAMVRYFTGAIIARLPKTGIFGPWSLAGYNGIWRAENSGGSLEFRSSFLQNPQYMFEMTKETPEEVLISLNRKYTWDLERQAIIKETSPPAIGFALLEVESNREVRAHLLSMCTVVGLHTAKRHRAVFGRYRLARGRYVLVPFLQEPQQEADYYLRIFLPRNLLNKELIYDQPQRGVFTIFTGTPVIITRINLLHGANLASLKSRGFGLTSSSSPYCRVSCERSCCTGRVVRENNNPVWNESFIFYRAKPNKQPIKIEVFDKRAIGADEFLGEGIINAPESTGSGDFDINLYTKPKDENRVRLKGTVSVSLYTVDMENYMNI
ncbi:Calpain-5 [Taenia solium]|eukprot:TsM_000664700 transcript=TsM_000664700 gene=TsM_000664700